MARSCHRLSADAWRGIAQGDGDAEAVRALAVAERSRRLLLLRALDDLTSRDGAQAMESAMGPLVSLAPAWELLSRAQRCAPQVVDDLLMRPQTGVWLALALRRVRDTAHEKAPLWVSLGQFNALAAAAAVRTGLDFSLAVPARNGYVPLPSLGCAVLPASQPWTTATVRAVGGRVEIEAAPHHVTLPLRPDEDGPGWHALHRVSAGPPGRRLLLVLDDLDPYRAFPEPVEPLRLPASDVRRWSDLLDEAWAVLLRNEPRTAEAMRRGLMSLTPIPAGEPFRPRSVTAGDAFGGVVASLPDNAAQLAETLVHEFQHIKLSGLLHLAALCNAVPPPGRQDDELFYAPWRDDPRPLGGLLQGIYAFAGVTRFWASHRMSATGGQAPLAHFEFAHWRAQTWSALRQVHGHRRLTGLGLTLVDTLRRRCADWLGEPVPRQQSSAAADAAADHRARWRLHHLAPDAKAVEDAVHAWLEGRRPPSALADEPRLAPDASADRLDSAAVLIRHRLAEPGVVRRLLRDGPEAVTARVAGTTVGDVLLACGDLTGARRAYLGDLANDPASPGAWSGLGRTLAADGADPSAACLLQRRPERAKAVQQGIVAAVGTPADPVRLAAWLGDC
ncbi:HEXXH motif domain-containing protein [Streptomyces sp. MUM 178J]|uniref:HEXXH motif domain-containing protein n=1 Tax=Streptomyces sp. MUM 178J TaxID=2791991 RepID=UPI001F03DDD8|nr:HEXXH motif domain-containing protein [Streptomyces sp. MUM 178J]WRQ78024.1 HEXXH motif domain-containing protein [Streptomyces sp. MUM 178J]